MLLHLHSAGLSPPPPSVSPPPPPSIWFSEACSSTCLTAATSRQHAPPVTSPGCLNTSPRPREETSLKQQSCDQLSYDQMKKHLSYLKVFPEQIEFIFVFIDS